VSLHYTKIMLAAGLAFFLVRTAATTVSFWMFDRTYDRELQALDHVPVGARMVSFVGEICGNRWRMSRLHHLPGLAIVRREAFSNEQWVMAGAQLLRVRFRDGLPFVHDPSQIVTSRRCPGEVYRPVNQALAQVPRDAFDYVWIINSPPIEEGLTKGLRPGLAERQERAFQGGALGSESRRPAKRPPASGYSPTRCRSRPKIVPNRLLTGAGGSVSSLSFLPMICRRCARRLRAGRGAC
jgi:hypothetical protein